MSYYSNGNVSVDEHFFRIDGKSYAIDKINSVDIRSKPKTGFSSVVATAVLTFLAAMWFFNDPGWFSAIATLLLGLMTWVSWGERNKRIYSLFLMTSSSENQAVTTEDHDDILRIRSAIERAMSRQPA